MDTSDSRHEPYYRQLCEHLGVALIATDRELTIRTWNAAASRLFGAGAERMIGSPITSVLPHDRRRAAERMLHDAVDTGEISELEFQYRDAHGKPRELTAAVAPVVSEAGGRIGASMCIRDITRRIALQHELYESRKMASLGEMAGAIAHHFNNTLGGVITSIDYANASDDSTVKNRVLVQTGRALMKVSMLVNGLLAFAEGDQRADDLSDLTEIIIDLADDLERDAHQRGIAFTLNLPQLPVLPVARVQVMTVLRNVTQNAVEAMPQGGCLRIDVSLEPTAIVIRVSDTGCGLDEAALSRVFEPFWSTKKQPGAGSSQAAGFGLAVAHGILQVLGGSITVESKPDQGSRFIVTLPKPMTN